MNRYTLISMLSGFLGVLMACSALVLLVATVLMWSNVEEEIQWAAYFDQTRVGLIIAIIVMFCTALFCFYIAYNPTGGPLGETLYIIGLAPSEKTLSSSETQPILHSPFISQPILHHPPSPSPSQETRYSLFLFPEVKPKVDPFVDGVTGVVDWKDNSSQKYYSENIDITYG